MPKPKIEGRKQPGNFRVIVAVNQAGYEIDVQANSREAAEQMANDCWLRAEAAWKRLMDRLEHPYAGEEQPDAALAEVNRD